MRGDLITGAAELEALVPAWDGLAVACGRPYAAPAWQLGWWRRAAPPGARALVAVARDGGEVAGVLALFGRAGRSGLERLRVMGAPMAQGTGPVAAPGREAQVAGAFAQALAGVRGPRPATVELEGVLEGRRWAALLCEAWPGRARPSILPGPPVIAPLARLGADSLDAWLAGRSANFRQQLRRSRRRLEDRGATFRRVDAGAEIAALLPAFVALHEDRWRERGGSRAVGADTQPVLADVARALDGTGRLTMELLEVDGQPVSAHLFLAAGEETTYWLGGFDEAYAADRPGLVALLQGVERALGRGAARLDLGPGDQPYKRRFADAERELDWLTLLLPGPRRPVTRLQLAPRRAARAVRARVPRQLRGGLAGIRNRSSSLSRVVVALAVLLMLLAPAPASASQTAGVQVHPLWEGVDRSQAARQLDDAAAAGARVVRIDVGWSSLQQHGPRRWSRWYLHRLDAVVKGARRRRLQPLLTVFGTPCWASTAPARLRQGCRGRWWERGVDRWAPRRARDYATAMAFLVRRYGRRVRAWEIWNEPNQTAFFRAPDPARAYARLLRAAHRAMKRADRRATVVGGALAEADVRFTARLYRLGVRGAFDAWSIHPYSGDLSPLDPRAGGSSTHSFVRGVPAVRAVMLRHHDDRPLWLTEFGWSTSTGRGGPSWTNGVDPATQARFLLEAFTRVRAWKFVDVAIWYTLADTSTDVSQQLDNFGLLNADGAPKPSFYSFRWAAAALRATP